MTSPTVNYSISKLSGSTQPIGYQDSDIVGLSNGGYAYVATSHIFFQNTTQDYVPAVIFNAAGVETAGANGIVPSTAGAIAQLTNGNIVFTSIYGGGGVNIYIETVNGTAINSDAGIGVTQDQSRSNADVAALAGGGFVVVDQRSETATTADIEVHTRNALGTGGTDFNLFTTAAADEKPSVIGLADGGFAVAWDRVASDGSTGVWTAVYNANGSVRSGPSSLDSTGSINKEVSLTALNSGGFALAYEDNGWAGQPDITVATFNAAGNFQQFTRASSVSTIDSSAAITTLSNGLMVTSFTNDFNGDGSDFDIRATLVDPSNVTALTSLTNPLTLAASGDDEIDSSISALPNLARFVVSYTDSTTAQIGEELFQLVRITTGTTGADTIVGDEAVDQINGGHGLDTLTGGANADQFIFDSAALSDAQSGILDHVTDYDRGNSGVFNVTEGDQINLAPLVATAYNHGSGQAVDSLVRVVASGTGATLLVDTDGTGNGAHWTPLARLDGLHAGSTVNVILDSSLTAGSPVKVAGAVTPDFNLDFTGDVLFRNDNGAVSTWDMNDHTFVGNNFAPVPTSWHIAGKGDFNGDGMTDIVWRNDNGAVSTWDMHDNTFTGFNFAPVPTTYTIVGTGDFNGDGKTDILWRDSIGNVSTWDMNDHTFVGNNFGPVPTSWTVAGTGDFNGDGKTDILWRDTSGNVSTWDMNDNTFVGFNFAPVPTTYTVVGTGDFNGDGKTDILWRDTSGNVSTWDMNDHTFVGFNFGAVPLSWTVAATGDFNGDGKTDIVWRNDNGAVSTWDMNDHTFTGFDFTASAGVVPTSWHIS